MKIQPKDAPKPATKVEEPAVEKERTAPEGVVFGAHTDPKVVAKILEAAKENDGRGTSYKRDNFQTWEGFCEWKRQRCLAKSARFAAEANDWELRKKGEALGSVAKKQSRIEKLKAQLAKLEQELSGSAKA